MKYLLLIALLIFGNTDERLVNWNNKAEKKDAQTVELNFKGKVQEGWYIYSSELEVSGPLETRINWTKNSGTSPIEGLKPVNPSTKYDEIWDGDIQYFEGDVHFVQKIKLNQSKANISGVLRYQVCINDQLDGRCVNEEQPFSFKL